MGCTNYPIKSKQHNQVVCKHDATCLVGKGSKTLANYLYFKISAAQNISSHIIKEPSDVQNVSSTVLVLKHSFK